MSTMSCTTTSRPTGYMTLDSELTARPGPVSAAVARRGLLGTGTQTAGEARSAGVRERGAHRKKTVDVLERRGARERRKRRGAKLSNKVRGRRRRRRQSTGTRLGRSARRQPAGAGNEERAGKAAATRGGSGGLAVACGRGGGAEDKGAKEAGREQGEGGAWKRPPRAVAAPSRRHVVSSCAALHETRPARKTATAP